MKLNKKGQMHTIEALLATVLIVGVVMFAANVAPREIYVADRVDTQLMLYGEDFLSILDMENVTDRTSWLYHQVNGTVNNSNWDGAVNISREWNNTSLNKLGIFHNVTIVNITQRGLIYTLNTNGTSPSREAITVSRMVVLFNPIRIFEVRLSLWYII